MKFLERIPAHASVCFSSRPLTIARGFESSRSSTHVTSAAIQFIDEVLRRLPFGVHVVQTDNGAEFQSQFHWHLESRDVRHCYIRPRTPRLNGKVERSHRVDDQEFYQLLDQDGISDDIHLFNEKLWNGRITTTIIGRTGRQANPLRAASAKRRANEELKRHLGF